MKRKGIVTIVTVLGIIFCLGAMMKFTDQQLRNWKLYERVRRAGRFNMFDPRARKQAGLNDADYLFVMENYLDLKRAVDARTNKK